LAQCGQTPKTIRGFPHQGEKMSDILKRIGQSVAHRASEPLQSPVLSFDLNDEIKRLREENAWQAGRNSKTLVKHPDFRLVLTVLKSGTRLQEHKAIGRISVQAVAGHIRMHVQDEVFDLPVGHLLALERAVPHDVEALEDSAFLLTIAWPEDSPKS
jgi:quercetin dioxygenase-like cupin family protein